ncbi:glycosyltransferase family 4 protein [Microvirga aerilata]|uniref:Glycosyltransferase family 4 protein n=1 Tax=Microvirga aerilata TaxID=670292 RepID=A0A936ZEN0_9HYPH|nr:glycosyltransferase family 4 protein [Microvirga aerilata]MBL0404390.1 glycosyltransferase family 4 protein [Microvirga aerilata]
MELLIVGGTPSHRGGVETFCERARAALTSIGHHQVEWLPTHTAFAKRQTLPAVFRSLIHLLKMRRRWSSMWLQYVNFPDLLFLIVGKLCGYHIVVTPHLGVNWRSQSSGTLRAISIGMLRFADRIALISPTQEQELQFPPSVPKCHIRTFLPGGIGKTEKQTFAKSSDGMMHLAHAGRLSSGKGTFLFLEVCAELNRAGRPFNAYLAGAADPSTKQQIDFFISENNLQSKIHVLGPLTEDALLVHLSKMDVLVHLSIIDSFPLIVLESIGCAVFPICKDLPGARYMVERYCGHVVGQNAVAETADFLLRADINEIRSAALDAAPRLGHYYQWQACVKALEAAMLSQPNSAEH